MICWAAREAAEFVLPPLSPAAAAANSLTDDAMFGKSATAASRVPASVTIEPAVLPTPAASAPALPLGRRGGSVATAESPPIEMLRRCMFGLCDARFR